MLEVDADRCSGHGQCLLYAPEVFVWDERHGRAGVSDRAHVAPDDRDVSDAVAACPEQAIAFRTDAR
jgi:ferredoxin